MRTLHKGAVTQRISNVASGRKFSPAGYGPSATKQVHLMAYNYFDKRVPRRTSAERIFGPRPDFCFHRATTMFHRSS